MCKTGTCNCGKITVEKGEKGDPGADGGSSQIQTGVAFSATYGTGAAGQDIYNGGAGVSNVINTSAITANAVWWLNITAQLYVPATDTITIEINKNAVSPGAAYTLTYDVVATSALTVPMTFQVPQLALNNTDALTMDITAGIAGTRLEYITSVGLYYFS